MLPKILLLSALCFAGVALSQEKTAAQQFKNIQVLKDIPASQIRPTMQAISMGLGVRCDFCHVPREFDKDDKHEKEVARQMITMVQSINRDNFNGKNEVTCWTCHRGESHPAAPPKPPAPGEKKG